MSIDIAEHAPRTAAGRKTDAALPPVLRSPHAMHAWRDRRRDSGLTVGLVPTMGSLHDGHVALLEAARAGNDLVVMSLFVNPAQFGSGSDLETYPRDEARDLAIAAASGVDVVYSPPAGLVYPPGFSSRVVVDGLGSTLEGATGGRGPEHLTGVTTVVAKLFNAVDPDRAYFGLKDAQQVATVRRMVADLEFRTGIVAVPTVRDTDGLALSSRNQRLSPSARRQATAIPAALELIAATVPDRGLDAALAAGRDHLLAAGIEPEYLEARNPDTMEPAGTDPGEILVVVAAEVGGVRLIDNFLIETETARSDR